jgi:tetratricopeptide (TPR) repeat protein
MKQNVIFALIIWGLSSVGMSAQSHFAKFATAFEAHDMVKAEKALHEWDLADANDPELYVAYFNFFTYKSMEKDSVNLDKQFAHKAIEFISEGVDRFPSRFDMRIVKIYMHARLGEFNAFTEDVLKLIEFSVKIDNQWKSEGFRLITEPYAIFSGAVAEFQKVLFRQNNNVCNKYVIKISETMIKYYPKNVQSYVNISTAYIETKEYDKSIDALLKAREKEPNNVSLMYKLAYVYKLNGDKLNAKALFDLTVKSASEKDEIYKKAAQKQLGEMS